MRFYWLLLAFFWAWEAMGAKWSLQITNPEYELKNTPLPAAEYRPFLPKTAWRCRFSSTVVKGEGKERREEKTVYCNYSIKKAGSFTTYLSCSPSHPHAEIKFDLQDQRKNLLFQMLLICQHES